MKTGIKKEDFSILVVCNPDEKDGEIKILKLSMDKKNRREWALRGK